MRVTTAGQTRAIITRLQDSQQRLAEAQHRATTGLRVERVSDDPTAAVGVMRAGAGIRGMEQYTRNAERLVSTLDAEDGALQQLADLVNRAKELGAGAMSVTMSAGGRAAAALELGELAAQAFDVANLKFGDEYLFGGTTSDGLPPFDPASPVYVRQVPGADDGDPATPPAPPVPRYPDGTREVEAGAAGQRLLGAHDGTTIFLGRLPDGTPDPTTGLLPALKGLQAALAAPDASGVDAAMRTLDAALTSLQGHVGELGARQARVDLARTGLAALGQMLTQEKSDLGEVDQEQAITEMLARQTAYQSAMLASSKVMGMSLADYLR